MRDHYNPGDTDGLISLLFAGLAFDLHCSVSSSQPVRTGSDLGSNKVYHIWQECNPFNYLSGFTALEANYHQPYKEVHSTFCGIKKYVSMSQISSFCPD